MKTTKRDLIVITKSKKEFCVKLFIETQKKWSNFSKLRLSKLSQDEDLDITITNNGI